MLNHVCICICICTSCLHLFYILLVFVLRQICCRQQHVLSLRQCVSVCQRCNAACHTPCITMHHRASQSITVQHSASPCITEQGIVIQKSALCAFVSFLCYLLFVLVLHHTPMYHRALQAFVMRKSGLNVGQSVPSVMQLVT